MRDHNETVSAPAYLDLVTRGTLWAAGALAETTEGTDVAGCGCAADRAPRERGGGHRSEREREPPRMKPASTIGPAGLLGATHRAAVERGHDHQPIVRLHLHALALALRGGEADRGREG